MKIAIIFKPYLPIQIPSLGGMSNFVYFLSKGLVKRGHKVTVFCSKNSKLAKGVKIVKSSQNEKKIDIYHAGDLFRAQVKQEAQSLDDAINLSFGELSNRFDYKIENYLQAFTKIDSEKFDAVHVVTHDTLGLYPALFSKTPSVISFHGHYSMLGPDFLRWLKFIKKNKIKSNSQFISVSKYIQKEYAKFVKSKLVYNSIDISPYKLQVKKGDYIAYLGRIDSKKGVEFAIEFSRKYKVPLIIAGNISNQWFFDTKIKPYIDNKLIKFIGLVNEKQKNKLLGHAKCLFMPTRYKEAFGRVIIESLACGTPVIAFNNGAVNELVINNKTGFLIKEDNLKQAKKSFDKIENIKSKVCRQFVEDNFILERMIKDYEKIYQEAK